MSKHFNVAVDADGIALITMDSPGRSMNVFGPEVEAELEQILERVVSDASIKGAIVTSGKPSFLAGYDLTEFLGKFGPQLSAAEAYEKFSGGLQHLLRKLETCGKPWVAAINGLALGGGFELCLACHYRVMADDPKVFLGLPEVKVGLLPGGGGTQRMPRLIGIAQALPYLLEGGNIPAGDAKKLGLVHEIVPPGELIEAARRWLLGTPTAVQPWDQKGYRVPGGVGFQSASVTQTFTGATTLVAKKTLHHYPAPAAILSCVYEGTLLPLDKGLEVEAKHFARLVTSPVSRNLIRTMFVNKGAADKLSARPAGVPKSQVQKLGVLGAGMMGAGIAYVSALAGIDVVLIDSTLELAERGKAYSAKLLARDVEKGRRSQEQAETVLARIRPTVDYAALDSADLVIEAVFEHRGIKAEVTQKAEAVLRKDAVFASNTSTLPITGLAKASQRPKNFIGVHFFSPVEKMPLVEIIVGKQTSDETIARALDYVGQLRKTPIVVNDSRGFYTSRCFGTYTAEGAKMLSEGIDPQLIESAGKLAGMPVGPLAVSDEVSLELAYKAMNQSREDLGAKYKEPISWPVVKHFVEDLKRLGRKSGAGFYDYPAGGRKTLWPGLRQEYKPLEPQPSVEELETRLLYVQALETARCYEEGVLRSVHEADLGSILGWGFPAYTGGTLSFIDTVGPAQFVAECKRLAKRYGERFKPTRGLLARAQSGETYYATAAPSAAQAS
ncbi:MAG TPA: 3-hydroxyacyl-CoA dehydrogenase NAD-binding domain-containing protein [Steroidobacteraceae bacterium]|nr:3-hydroxyacyl-CoA dehydrogenase NAD-binding domain-containing protein [Steroidobacteraceae bacterium]